VRVDLTSATRELVLTAEARAFQQTTIFAKVSGYVRRLAVERGQRVNKGELIAELEVPENERDVEAARSDLLVKRVTADRQRSLAKAKLVAPQDRDDAAAAERIALATYERAKTTFGYSELRAPFDGVVTARYVDNGALLPSATSATQSAQAVIDLSDTDRLRVFVYVGQDAAPFVHEGDATEVWQDELPQIRLHQPVTRTTQSLDVHSRTMQVEIDVDNRRPQLLPGTFVRVALKVAVPPSPLVPNEALVVRNGKTQVALLVGDHVHYVPIELGSTDGKSTRILRGLAGGETIGVNVPVEVNEGSAVRPKPR
jgi:RND family efflux transporter MFP subunit